MPIQEPTPGYKAAKKKQRKAEFDARYDRYRAKQLQEAVDGTDDDFKTFVKNNGGKIL